MVLTGILMLLAAAAPPSNGEPVIPAFFTGERLYKVCTDGDLGHCWMYVAGVLDGVFESEAAIGERSLCTAPLTNRDAAKKVIEFLRDNPEFRSKAAAVGVKAALKSSLPCDEP